MPNNQVFIQSPDALYLSNIQHSIDKFDISQGYFSSILASQTAIFSLIVAGIITLYFFFNKKTSQNYIKTEMDKYFDELKNKSAKDLDEKMEKLENVFTTRIEQHEKAIGKLTGANYRTLGQFWDSENNYSTAFIWWFRAAHQFAIITDDKLTRICLSSAKDSVEKIGFGFELDTEIIGEYQRLLPEISDTYKIEKDLVDKSIKNILTKKPASTI